jgi:hypothetical protein
MKMKINKEVKQLKIKNKDSNKILNLNKVKFKIQLNKRIK